jgi:photosystem I subunit 10
LLTPSLLAVAVERSSDWGINVGIVMILCNIVAIAIGKFTIQQQNVGPKPPSDAMFGGMSLGAVLGTTAFGHILGAGTILGLTNLGVL